MNRLSLTYTWKTSSQALIVLITILTCGFYMFISDTQMDAYSTMLSILIGIMLGLNSFYVQWLEYENFSARRIRRPSRIPKFISVRKQAIPARRILFGVIFALYGYIQLGQWIGIDVSADPLTSIVILFLIGTAVDLLLGAGGIFGVVLPLESVTSLAIYSLLYANVCILIFLFSSFFMMQNLFLLAALISRLLFEDFLYGRGEKYWRYSLYSVIAANILFIAFLLATSLII